VDEEKINNLFELYNYFCLSQVLFGLGYFLLMKSIRLIGGSALCCNWVGVFPRHGPIPIVCAKHHTIQTLHLVGEEARTYHLSTYFPLPDRENKTSIFPGAGNF